MPRISIQKPTDQPSGAGRLLEEFRRALGESDLNDFKLMVAFAKVGPLLRLSAELAAWKSARKTIRAIIGVDQQGTSVEALDFARANFSETFIAHVVGPFSPTFHPKLYIFKGPRRAVAFVGSNNLTVGGTESNLESHVRVEFDLPDDAESLSGFEGAWDDALRVSAELTPELLLQLQAANLIVTEEESRRNRTRTRADARRGQRAPPPNFPAIVVVPPSAIPTDAARGRGARRRVAAPAPQALPPPPPPVEALVIQIIPHHNGEVFLSRLAVNQNPAFFGWPFTGQSVPKRGNNRPYPQRVPDPVVNIRIFNRNGRLVVRHDRFNLNTVYYEKKSEIRITVPQNVVRATPGYSVLVMSQSAEVDYDMDIFVPGSDLYETYLARCNVRMPTGGKGRARYFGWI